MLTIHIDQYSALILTTALVFVCIYDIIYRKIPNFICLFLCIYGTANWVVPFGTEESVPLNELPIEGSNSLSFFLNWIIAVWVTGLMPLILYIRAGGGAGDVKLAWGIGACLGLGGGLTTVFLAYFFAGIFAILAAASHVCASWFRKSTKRYFTEKPDCERSGIVQGPMPEFSVPMGPFFLIGYLLFLFDSNLLPYLRDLAAFHDP